MASPTQWTWVWANSGRQWRTGKPSVLQSMGSQRVGHDWATKLNWSNTVQCIWKIWEHREDFRGVWSQCLLTHETNHSISSSVGWIMDLQGCLCPNPQNLWICYLTHFVDTVKVKDLEIKRLSWIIQWVQSNHMNSLKQGTFPSWRSESDNGMERCEVKKTGSSIAGFEDRGRVPWAKESQWPLEAGRGNLLP